MIDILRVCLNTIYEKDNDLIDINIHEDAINHRLAGYLAKSLEEGKIIVDAEYNRHIDALKKYGVDKNSAIVDIVVHQRKTDDNNIIALECKKSKISSTDLAKIRALVGTEFNYQYGATIEYMSKEIKLYQRVGDNIEEETIEL